MIRRKLYNDKAYWKRRFKQLDLEVLQLLNFERSGAIDVALTDYIVKGHDAVKLGLTGEVILGNMVRYGFPDKSVIEMRNLVNMVEVFSLRLKSVAENKWGKELESFPTFKCSVAAVGELIEKTAAIREMNEMLEEE